MRLPGTVVSPRPARAFRGAATVFTLAFVLLATGCGADGQPRSTATTTRFTLADPLYRQAAAQRRATARAKARAAKQAAALAAAQKRATTTPEAVGADQPGPVARPPIVSRPIPFTAQRRQEMAAYSQRHYGGGGYRLTNPKVIVQHYTETPDFSSTFNVFAPDVPDVELHELPGLCAHFVVDKDGTISQLVPLGLRCRHTVGLNWTAIGIEQVGSSDREILQRPAQLDAIIRLTAWLQCRYGIRTRNVIGHNESLSSPYHHENVASLRTQTHGDWVTADMDVVRAKLRQQPCG